MSERRACRLIKADRKTVRYRSRRPRDDALRGRLRALAAEQRRFGYRRLHILLRAEGHVLNRKKTQRLYREEGLTVRKRKGRKRATGMRAPILVEARPDARWSVDFVHEPFIAVEGARLKIFAQDVYVARGAVWRDGLRSRSERHLLRLGQLAQTFSPMLPVVATNWMKRSRLDSVRAPFGCNHELLLSHSYFFHQLDGPISTKRGARRYGPGSMIEAGKLARLV